MGAGVVVGIDVATQAVRVVCADGDGRVLASAGEPLPAPRRPAPGHVEQDARAWWPAVATALRAATDALGPQRRRRIVAVTVSATSGTVLLADARGEPLGPALLYSDRRATAEAARAQEAGRERWERLGLRIAPSFGLPKLAWLCAQHGALDRAAHAWSAADVIVTALTGGPATTDWSHALKSGYDCVRREWPHEVYDALGVPARLLPEVRAPTTACGEVPARTADATGLPRGCSVRLGMTDGCAAQIACGAVAPGRFVSVLGTTLVVKGVSATLARDPAGVVYSHLHPDGWWLPGGASNTGGAAVADRRTNADLAALDAAAAARGPAGAVRYPLAGVGERFPFAHPAAHAFVLGTPSDDVERHRAALEGVAFVERLAYERLTALGIEDDGTIISAGGGSRSPTWSRIRATVLGRPLTLRANPTTALGACVLAAAGTLHESVVAAAGAMVRSDGEVEPVEYERASLDASYARFVAELERRGWLPDRGQVSPRPVRDT